MPKLCFEETIYTYHIDFVGHVNNLNYIQWMENGRVKLLEAVGMPVAEIVETSNFFPILSETAITYKKPLFLKNKVKIETWLSQINNASVIMEFRFYNEKGELCASGHQKGLFVNAKTMRPARIPKENRKSFEHYYIEA
ncbi:MAG: thioesterase [Draconibacterium sp.]|nr:MAG: thioesterase [Draconibacterium sp.]